MSRSKRGRRGGGRPPQYMGNVTTGSNDNIRVIRTGEVIDLGDLSGETMAEVTASFTIYGVRYRVNPGLTELDVVDLLEQANTVNTTDPRSMTIVKDYARSHVHPDDFEAFWSTVRKHRWDTAKLMELCWTLLDGITGNPTGERSGSSAGQLETKTSSPSPSTAPVADLGEQRARRDAYVRHIQRLENERDERGEPLPVNAAIQLQLLAQAKAQGIDVEAALPSARATA